MLQLAPSPPQPPHPLCGVTRSAPQRRQQQMVHRRKSLDSSALFFRFQPPLCLLNVAFFTSSSRIFIVADRSRRNRPPSPTLRDPPRVLSPTCLLKAFAKGRGGRGGAETWDDDWMIEPSSRFCSQQQEASNGASAARGRARGVRRPELIPSEANRELKKKNTRVQNLPVLPERNLTVSQSVQKTLI